MTAHPPARWHALLTQNRAWRRSAVRWVALMVLSPLTLSLAAFPVRSAVAADGELRLKIVDAATGEPMAARMHLKNSRGRPVPLRLPGLVVRGDHFYVDGSITLPLNRGQYTFDIETGPEFRTVSGHFEIVQNADDDKTIEMRRITNLADEGWYAGDLFMTGDPADMPLVMRAEGLHVAPLCAWIDSDRTAPRRGGAAARAEAVRPEVMSAGPLTFGPLAQLVERNGSGLLLFNLPEPLDAGEANRLMHGAAEAGAAEETQPLLGESGRAVAHVVAHTPFAWELPVWLAGGRLDAMQLIHQHSLRAGVVDNEADGRPRNRTFFPAPQGNSRWSEAIYHHVLESGLRIPPAGGSGSGTNDSPAGTNRVYVYCGDEFSYERWWEGLAAGRVFVTNGPLLRPLVNGQRPGYVFRLDEGGELQLEIGLNLATRTGIEYLEIIKNGESAGEVRLDELAKSAGRLPPLVFNESGWFVVRAVAATGGKREYATSGPYYVEKAGRPRISRRSVQFFLDWLDEAEARTARLPAAQRDPMLAMHAHARSFWTARLEQANAD